MKILLGYDSARNVVCAFGHSDINDDDEGSPPFSCEVKEGKLFLGLEFDELKALSWVETDDEGNLVGKSVKS